VSNLLNGHSETASQSGSSAPNNAFKTWLRLEWDRVGAWVLILGGAVIIILGYVGVSGTVFPAEQLPYIISGGIGGLSVLGVGCMLWLSADLRDEWRKLDRIERAVSGSNRNDDALAEHVDRGRLVSRSAAEAGPAARTDIQSGSPSR
jgi:hypothetical protein